MLVDGELRIKVADLGLACKLGQADAVTGKEAVEMDRMIQTMYYRAPEIMAGAKRYGVKVDSWSIG